MLDSAIHQINDYPADKYYGNQYYYFIRSIVIQYKLLFNFRFMDFTMSVWKSMDQ